MTHLALSVLACGYLCHVYTDSDRPTFMPLWNFACNEGGPNPDYVYLQAEVDEAGTYELTGFRGTSRFVEITQQQRRILDMSLFSRPTGGSGVPPTTHELDDLTIGEDGSFRVILSAERPEGHTGDWWPMDPGVESLLLRKCACDWVNEVDARIAINRLDPSWRRHDTGRVLAAVRRAAALDRGDDPLRHPPRPVLPGAPRKERAAPVAVDQADRWPRHEAGVLRRHPRDRRRRGPGRRVPGPRPVPVLAILVADDRFSTVDWVNRQSSLNDVQAHLDDDGWFHGVVSKQDPGVWNWLDKADVPWGSSRPASTKLTSTPKPRSRRCPSPTCSPTSPPPREPSLRRSERRSSSSGARAPSCDGIW